MEIEDPRELAAMRLLWAAQSPAVRAEYRGLADAEDDSCPTCGSKGARPCVVVGSPRRTEMLRYHPARVGLATGSAA